MTPPVDIRGDHLRIVQDVLRRHLPDDVTVWVFGSRATWMTKDSSDLDLALEGDTAIPPRSLSTLEVAFEDSDLPFAVDIVDVRRINERFRRIVAEQRVRLPESDGSRPTVGSSGGLGICPDWREMPFTEAFLVNPTTQVDRGRSLPFVDMATVDPSFRSVRASEVREFRGGGSRFRDGDTLMARITPCLENGKVARYCADGAPEPAHGSTEFIVVRGCPGTTDTEFAYYMTRSSFVRDYAIGQMTGTSGRQRVPTESLEHLTIAVPSLPEQRAVAHILGTLDDKIELNRRMNATLEAMARALFKSWFVDFDPVRAKLAGRDTGLPKEIADLFPDRLVDSELGEVPAGWGIESLSEHFDAVKGVSYKGSGLGRGGTPLHNLNSVHEGGGYKYEGIKFYAGEHAGRHIVRPGDVIVANTEQGHDRLLIGYAAIVPRFFGDHGIASHHVYRLRPRNNGHLSTPFLYWLLNSPSMHDLVSGYANGTTVNMLPIDAVQKPMVSVPPRALLDAFDTLALHLGHRREQAVRESHTLGFLRDALLPKLVSGEMHVRDAEKLVGVVA